MMKGHLCWKKAAVTFFIMLADAQLERAKHSLSLRRVPSDVQVGVGARLAKA